MGLHKRADEYPRGAGRICNAPSSRTAALGIGPYNHDRKCGIGYVSYQSMVAGDIPFSMFYLSFMAVLTLASNLLTDILYGVVDPRVRIS